MKPTHRLMYAAANRLAHRGFEVRRHPAVRRQAILTRCGVDLVLDVGASGGGYGTLLRSFGYSGRIHSFEPLSTAYAELRATVADDHSWTTRNVALGADPGETTINIASNSTSSSILPMLDAHVDAAPTVHYVDRETIAVARLDDEANELITRYQRPFLKIDTQGFEREVLAGGQDTLTACVGVQLELSLVPLYEGGMLIDEALSWAYDHGFIMVGVEQGYAAPSGEILQIDGVFERRGT